MGKFYCQFKEFHAYLKKVSYETQKVFLLRRVSSSVQRFHTYLKGSLLGYKKVFLLGKFDFS